MAKDRISQKLDFRNIDLWRGNRFIGRNVLRAFYPDSGNHAQSRFGGLYLFYDIGGFPHVRISVSDATHIGQKNVKAVAHPRKLDQTFGHDLDRKFNRVFRIGFRQDIFSMRVHRMLADEKVLGNFLTLLAFENVEKHFFFTRCEDFA